MSCRLCLSETEILIPVFDEQGKDTKGIVKVAEKYLSVELTDKNKGSIQICICCWSNLDNFQKFCRLIEEKQSHLKMLTKTEVPGNHEAEKTQTAAEQGNEIEIEMADVNKDASSDEVKDVLVAAQDVDEDDWLANAPDTDESNEEELKESKQVRAKSKGCSAKKTTADGSNKRKIGRPGKRDINSYQDEDRLIANHMLLICDLCQEEQKTFYELKQHYKQTHKREGYAVCCNKRLYKKGLLVEHIHVHNNPDYFKCEECAHVFADRVCLRNHTLLKHNQDGDLPYACKSCPRKFAKIYFLQRHALRHATGDEKTFQCTHCKKGYPSLSRLKGHLRNVHGEGGLKVCSHCGALIRGTAAFRKHIRQHEGIVERGVQCEVCSQWLSDKYVLRCHMERHAEPKTYTCDICGKEAPSRTAINSHYRYHHTNAEPTHKCGVCSKAFKTPRSLREHIATHTGETLYTCTYCPKTFKCSSNLHSHRKWQHPVEWANEKQHPKKCSDS